MHGKATSVAETLAAAQETRRQWGALTEPTRRMAMAADLELRRRRPEAGLAPLKNVEPAADPNAVLRQETWVQLSLTGGAHIPEAVVAPAVPDLRQQSTSTRRDVGAQQPLALDGENIAAQVSEQLARITENARRAQEKIDYLRSLPRFAEDDHSVYLGPAWDVLARRERDAILQPPKPELTPASAVMHRAGERVAVAEAEHG
jgi:hypothetical protein